MSYRQTSLRPEQGGKFHRPVGSPVPPTVADIAGTLFAGAKWKPSSPKGERCVLLQHGDEAIHACALRKVVRDGFYVEVRHVNLVTEESQKLGGRSVPGDDVKRARAAMAAIAAEALHHSREDDQHLISIMRSPARQIAGIVNGGLALLQKADAQRREKRRGRPDHLFGQSFDKTTLIPATLEPPRAVELTLDDAAGFTHRQRLDAKRAERACDAFIAQTPFNCRCATTRLAQSFDRCATTRLGQSFDKTTLIPATPEPPRAVELTLDDAAGFTHRQRLDVKRAERAYARYHMGEGLTSFVCERLHADAPRARPLL